SVTLCDLVQLSLGNVPEPACNDRPATCRHSVSGKALQGPDKVSAFVAVLQRQDLVGVDLRGGHVTIAASYPLHELVTEVVSDVVARTPNSYGLLPEVLCRND